MFFTEYPRFWWLSEQIATMNFEKINLDNHQNLGYSVKNIPIPPKKLYLKFMLDKVESFIKRLRWKAFYFDKKQLNQDEEPYNRSFSLVFSCCCFTLFRRNSSASFKLYFFYLFIYFVFQIFNRPLTSPGRRNSLLGQIKLMLN